MKRISSLYFLLFATQIFAQQITHTDLIAEPVSHTFAVSGIGGGNLYELNSRTGSSSAQVTIDWNLFNKATLSKKEKEGMFTLATTFRYNPIITTRMLNKDSLLVRKLPFNDNEYLLHFGLRARQIKSLRNEESETQENADFLHGGFADMLYTPYNIRLSDTATTQFGTFNLNLGYQAGFFNRITAIGTVGITGSLQGNYLMILDDANSPMGFEKSIRSNVALPSQVMGAGGKLTFQINDFAIYFEMRHYFPIGNGDISGLTNSPILSFGGIATGTAFKSGKVDENGRW